MHAQKQIDRQGRRAKLAYKLAAGKEFQYDEIVSLVRQLPMTLRINGLLATWAHYCAKREPAHRQVLGAVLRHLSEEKIIHRVGGKYHSDETVRQVYLDWMGNSDDGEPLDAVGLRDLTHEALQFSGWLKRAVDAAAIGDES